VLRAQAIEVLSQRPLDELVEGQVEAGAERRVPLGTTRRP
jgi:hypothetical protein